MRQELLLATITKPSVNDDWNDYLLKPISSKQLGAPMQRTYKRNPWSGSLFANPNPKLLARFLLMKLSCGKAKVGLNWSDKFKSNSSLLSVVLIGAPWQQIFLLARKTEGICWSAWLDPYQVDFKLLPALRGCYFLTWFHLYAFLVTLLRDLLSYGPSFSWCKWTE